MVFSYTADEKVSDLTSLSEASKVQDGDLQVLLKVGQARPTIFKVPVKNFTQYRTGSLLKLNSEEIAERHIHMATDMLRYFKVQVFTGPASGPIIPLRKGNE